ncbi:2-dehydro-3-deoxy-6-phosphogalactonate aldolase [Dyella sp. A6]|uniref:2-dehydro-3-deoxy-6-phosphogalactonate aldolase n=1 Tax=Dyella aluminiiresistens TaxID=3069105 RepID=UPI002E7868E7|nr:2-dehydro-3-deoxy-6-phosphogalactonate aldolase [Dyella sp. A6]
MLTPWLSPLPLVAILRGLRPDEAVATGRAIVDAGFRILEVPLNSPQPTDSIAQLAAALGNDVLVGAGTVMSPDDVAAVAAAGGRLIVMPHADVTVIRAAKASGLLCVPGVATPTEAFAALAAGADGLKLFPAEQAAPAVLKAWRAVLPRDVPVLPVGGISPDNMAPWVAAGAAGFGIGSALFAPGRSLDDTAARARAFAQAWRDLAT